MTSLDELKTALSELSPGKMAVIYHDVYAELFPPGEPDEKAREACHHFAKASGCRIENHPDKKAVWFIKDVQS
jgi:hypothetical protein